MVKKTEQEVWIIYDGECPLCNYSAKMVKIKKAVGRVQLINARSSDPMLEQVKIAGLDLNEGFIVKFNDNFYHGPDALHFLAMIGDDDDWFNKLNIMLFRRSLLVAKILYPLLKILRNVLLYIRRVPKIPKEKESS